MGHYKVAAHNEYLSMLHSCNPSLVSRTGVHLDHWGNGLTVLLQKILGSICIDKLLNINLLEADFNWLNKLVFAKRMMSSAIEQGIIPPDQFAKRNTRADDGTLKMTSTGLCTQPLL